LLRVFKYLLFSILFVTSLYGDILTWGGYTKIDISKNEVNEIIKNYVDKTYPKKVAQYNKQLDQIKQKKLEAVSDKTFVHNNLMWQDITENKTLKLNQLKAKRYCKNLVLAKRKDWRVPSYKELLGLVDYTKIDSASISLIKNISGTSYWSDTQKHLKKKQKLRTYWFVEFLEGSSGFSNEMEMKNIRCVREISTKKDDY